MNEFGLAVIITSVVAVASLVLAELLRPRPPLRGPPGPRPIPRPRRITTGLFTDMDEAQFFRGHPGVPTTNPFDPPLESPPPRRRRRSYWIEPDDMDDES